VDTSRSDIDGWGSGQPAMEWDDAPHSPTARTPEEVARAFLEEGGTVVPGPDEDRRSRWHWSTVAGVAAAAIALAALAAFTLLTTGHTTAPPHSDSASHHALVAPTTGQSTTTTSTTAVATLPSSVSVDVLNASTSNGVAGLTAAALHQQGFVVTGIGTAPNKIADGAPSEIHYGPDGVVAAHTLAAVLSGPVTLVSDPTVSGSNVTLLVASAQLTVVPSTTSTTTAATATSTP